jgi:hypothetical protein
MIRRRFRAAADHPKDKNQKSRHEKGVDKNESD